MERVNVKPPKPWRGARPPRATSGLTPAKDRTDYESVVKRVEALEQGLEELRDENKRREIRLPRRGHDEKFY